MGNTVGLAEMDITPIGGGSHSNNPTTTNNARISTISGDDQAWRGIRNTGATTGNEPKNSCVVPINHPSYITDDENSKDANLSGEANKDKTLTKRPSPANISYGNFQERNPQKTRGGGDVPVSESALRNHILENGTSVQTSLDYESSENKDPRDEKAIVNPMMEKTLDKGRRQQIKNRLQQPQRKQRDFKSGLASPKNEYVNGDIVLGIDPSSKDEARDDDNEYAHTPTENEILNNEGRRHNDKLERAAVAKNEREKAALISAALYRRGQDLHVDDEQQDPPKDNHCYFVDFCGIEHECSMGGEHPQASQDDEHPISYPTQATKSKTTHNGKYAQLAEAQMTKTLSKVVNNRLDDTSIDPSLVIDNGEDEFDLDFIRAYDAFFIDFLWQNPEFEARNPDLIENLRVLKLQRILETSIAAETRLKTELTALRAIPKLSEYSTELEDASREKDAQEAVLQQELFTIQQASCVMEGRLTWQAISLYHNRAKSQQKLLRELFEKDNTTPLELLPQSPSAQAIKDAITKDAAPCLIGTSQESDLPALQVENAFLKAESELLQKKLNEVEATAKKHAWVDSVFLRLDSSDMNDLHGEYQEKLGVQF